MSPPKFVFAHFMVGNTYPYSIDDWVEEIELATNSDIDGFALNVGRERWQLDRVADCFEAASRTGSRIMFFLSFDMSSLPAENESDVELLLGYLEKLGHSDRMFRLSGRVVVSTFAGERSLFGQPSLDKAWFFVKHRIQDIVGVQIHYLPSLFIDPAQYRELPCLDGVFHWNGGWPVHLHLKSSRREIECPRLDSDQEHIIHLNGKTYMAAVSPWFFTHYGAESWNKNWVYRGDDWLFVQRWDYLIQNRHLIDIVQVISWNDYGESHYIGPIRGAQPNSESWVNGFPHEAWLYLNSYYCRAFKEGCYPPITKDAIFMWARPHPREAQASCDAVSRPDNWELTEDYFWVVIFARGTAEAELSAGECRRKYLVREGVNLLSMRLQVGHGMGARMYRGGVIAADCVASGYCFEPHPQTYNFNAFTAMSS
ncbi:glycoside hydrolase family 71 protein [Dendrothele bispora CBS 962.96]|uniref:Glycoside hydrolase family 71 protein n=1 Tax=Dendrothele bispora (strain CBS 962.96) TaxID=1314807 RepID=A0A4S8MT51_DENBC|nr:glycoside hydrolase family 71 protein [Dendrothele bispora CBS 962.96]